MDLKFCNNSAGGFWDVRLYVLLALVPSERLTSSTRGTVDSQPVGVAVEAMHPNSYQDSAYLVNIFALDRSIGH